MKQVKSLRDYIEALKQLGEVQEIEHEVDWNLEIGAIIRRCNETGAPAPLFNNIRGIEKGFRVFGAPVGVSQQKGLYLARIAMSLGLDARASGQELVTALAQAREKALIAPKRIETAPHKRHILKGEHVDLLRFPTPLIHQADGGRYFNTWGTIVVQSPDKKWTSWSITRIMLLDGKHMTGLLNPHQHVGRIHAMWRELGRPTPFALALGCEPAIPVISGMALPDFVDENAFLGAYFGEPLEVVRCAMSDLEVPATAEIVVEGTISQDEQALEGPMGEYLGYMGQEQAMQPIYTVTAISFRENPILPVVAAGEPIDDDHTVIGITGSAEILHVLQSNGVPARMVWSVLESANTWLVVTMPATWQQQTGMRKEALLQKIGDLVFSTKYSGFVSTILVMDDDIDPTNTSEVLWAFTTRCRPQIDVTYFADRIMVPLAPYLVPAEKKKAPFITKQVFNGLVDIPRGTDGRSPMRSSFAHCYPQELQNKVLQNWSSYGFRHV